MTLKIIAQVQSPFFGYRLMFKEPLFDLEALDTKAAKAAFSAFREWNVSLENVSFKDDGKNLAEEATNIVFLGGRVTFSITPAGCALGVVNPNWAEAELIMKIAEAGTTSVLKALNAAVERQFGSIHMHLTPQGGMVRDITSKVVKIDMQGLTGSPANGFGFSIYQDDMLWVVDMSASFPNSLFVRMDRWFRAESSFQQIVQQLRDDEVKLLALLGLEVE